MQEPARLVGVAIPTNRPTDSEMNGQGKKLFFRYLCVDYLLKSIIILSSSKSGSFFVEMN
jgi:hypothetical protein